MSASAEPQLPLAPAFAPTTRVILAANPATKWAADLSISTAVALMAALDECFVGGAALYETRSPLPIDVDEAARNACRRVVRALAGPPLPVPETPRADAGFSPELLDAWVDSGLNHFKHVRWAAGLTADAVQALLAALDGCPAPTQTPAMYLLAPAARALAGQKIVAEIVAGSPVTFDVCAHRIRDELARVYAVDAIISEFVERARARLLRAHGDALSRGVFRSLLVEPSSQFRGLTYEEFLARLRGHVARFDAMGEDDLVAHSPGARGRSSAR